MSAREGEQKQPPSALYYANISVFRDEFQCISLCRTEREAPTASQVQLAAVGRRQRLGELLRRQQRQVLVDVGQPGGMRDMIG